MSKQKLLVVVDVQNDFVDGPLGTPEARAIIPNIVNKIQNWDGAIVSTFDTHTTNYLDTNEGRHLPVVHCVKDTYGWQQNYEVVAALEEKKDKGGKFPDNAIWSVDKFTFGSMTLPSVVFEGHYDYIELVGLCTDICVVSNALILKANYPEIDIAVDSACCAGVTPETHKAALTTMKMCQIDIIGESFE